MENERSLMQVHFIEEDELTTHYHQNLEIIYVIRGKVSIQIDDAEYHLMSGDFLLINANKHHSFIAVKNFIGARFEINFHLLAEYMGTMQLMFWCNTTSDHSDAYDDVRKKLDQILEYYFEREKQGSLRLNALYYEALYIITSNFMVKADDMRLDIQNSQDKTRIRQIQNYIQANYQKQISLNDLAEQLFLSTAYLSKYIKRHFGLTFLEYLNNVRLFHAVDELIYTNKNLTHIAMDNGYPSSAAFNKSFRDIYGEAPGEHRKRMKQQNTPGTETPMKEEKIQQWLLEYLNYKEEKNMPEASDHPLVYRIEADKIQPLDMSWCKAVNIGEAYMLLQSIVQNQLLELSKETGIIYVRIWNLLSREYCFDEKEGCNFRKLNIILDFLIDHHLKPYLELGNKPEQFMYTPERLLMKNTDSQEIYPYPVFCDTIQALCINLANRYGVDELESWYFEFWNEPELHMEQEDGEYYRYFAVIYHSLKAISSKIKIGGAGFILGYEAELYQEIFRIWKKKGIWPDFISFCSYQYIAIKEEEKRYGRKSIDRHYMKNQMKLVRKIMEQTHFHVPEIHVNEWNFTVSNRNIINDSCEQGAYIIKTCIDMIGNVNFIAYWHGLDVYSEYYDSDCILNGDSGLISRDGIHKPSFYAFWFLNRLMPHIVYKNEHCIVTSNGRENYVIVCHNYKQLSAKYVFDDEDEILPETLEQYMEDTEGLDLTFNLQNLRNGSYQVKTYYMNKDNGSVQNIWKKLSYARHLTKDEIEYVKVRATPEMEMTTFQVQDGNLTLKNRMQTQEIRMLDIRYCYS